MCVENPPRRLTLYSLATLARLGEYSLPHPVSFAAFSGDGKRLLVLTSDQTVFILDAAAQPPLNTPQR